MCFSLVNVPQLCAFIGGWERITFVCSVGYIFCIALYIEYFDVRNEFDKIDAFLVNLDPFWNVIIYGSVLLLGLVIMCD